MLKTLSKFSYPTFIGICGFVGTMTDLFQKTDVAFGSALALLALGVLILVLPQAFVVDRVWKGWLNQKVEGEYGKGAFGISCIMLAGLLYGFSTLSAKAANDGGLIASQIPEFRQMQVALGIVQKQIAEVQVATTEIKSDTGKLLEASDRWLDFNVVINVEYRADANGNAVPHAVAASPSVNNETNLQFENVQITLSSPENGIDYRHSLPLLPDRQYRMDEKAIKATPKTMTACISAKMRGHNEWLRERQTLRFTLENNHIYEKVDSSGVMVFSEPVSCGDA